MSLFGQCSTCHMTANQSPWQMKRFHQLIVVQLNKYFIRWLSASFLDRAGTFLAVLHTNWAQSFLTYRLLLGHFGSICDHLNRTQPPEKMNEKIKDKSAQRKCRSEILIMRLRIHLLYCFDQVVVYDLIGKVSSFCCYYNMRRNDVKWYWTNNSPHIQLHWDVIHQ